MNDNLYVKLEVTLSLNDWSIFQSMLVNPRVNLYELEVINKIHEGCTYDVAPDFEIDINDLPM